MANFDFEELLDTINENKINIAMGALGLTVAVSMTVGGGSQKLSANMASQELLNTAANKQTEAEEIFSQFGCAIQFYNAKTGKNDLTEGTIAVEPSTGGPINGGFVCSSDGGIWQVTQGGVVRLVGASPKIKKWVITQGALTKTREMKKFYGVKQ